MRPPKQNIAERYGSNTVWIYGLCCGQIKTARNPRYQPWRLGSIYSYMESSRIFAGHWWKVYLCLIACYRDLFLVIYFCFFRYNICRDSVTETREICEELINRVFRVEYNKRDKDFLSMSSALINGMWHVQPLLNVNVMMAYIHKRLLELNSNSANPNCDSYMRQMSTFERFYFNYIKYSMHYKQYSIIRLMSNWLQYLALWFMQNFPFLAYYRFGIANTLVRILDWSTYN